MKLDELAHWDSPKLGGDWTPWWRIHILWSTFVEKSVHALRDPPKPNNESPQKVGEAENVNQSYLNRGDRVSSTLPGVKLVYVTLQDGCFEMHIGKTQRNLNLNFLKIK